MRLPREPCHVTQPLAFGSLQQTVNDLANDHRGRFEQPDRTDVPAWAHPVIAGGKLYIRDQGTLFCYDVAAK
jgi:hypothetical protein